MEQPKRKPNRLKHYDYSSNGAYFITICTEDRKPTLSTIVGDGFPVPKSPGKIAERYIQQIPDKYPCVRVDHYVVMPNHIHLLLSIDNFPGAGNPSPTMGKVIGWYKYQVTKQINQQSGTQGARAFQRSFHDHVIRSEVDYLKIWNYIQGNPSKRKEDCFYTPEEPHVAGRETRPLR